MNGARCDLCPLRTQREGEPVPSELREGKLAVIAQCPGRTEVERNKPLVGQFGVEVNRALQAVGLSRGEVSLHNAVACMPPNGDYRAFLKKLEAENKKRDKKGYAKVPTPHECCAPRLVTELQEVDHAIPIGAVAAHTVLGGNAPIMNLRGQLIEVPEGPLQGLKVVPTVANILYARRYRRVFLQDIARAVRWFTDKLPWNPPTMAFIPAVSERYPNAEPVGTSYDQEMALNEIRAFLAKPRQLWCSDIETVARYYTEEGKPKFDPLHDVLRCIGVGDREEVLTIGVNSVHPSPADPLGKPLWWASYERELCRIVIEAINDGRLLVGHNFGSYDKLALRAWARRHGLPEPDFDALFDTLMAVRVVEPELPKGLGFCATVYMDEGTPSWKAEHTATEAATDFELWHYNGLDVAINARLAVSLAKRVRERQQDRVLAMDHKMQSVTVGLHEQGLYVNQSVRREWANKLQQEMAEYELQIMDVLAASGHDGRFGRAGDRYNPASPYHVREVLFDHFDLHPPSSLRPKELFTDSGERSTGKAIFNAYLADPMTPPLAMAYLEAQRRWRKAAKLYGTYIKKAHPQHSASVIDPITGRVHAEWKAHATLVGRMACAGPNLLNQPKKLRNMYEAQEGHSYVGADWSALHLYIIAMRWGIPSLMEAFTQGKDGHALFAGIVFGDRFWKADGLPSGPPGTSGEYTGNAGKMRSVTKTVRYAGAYMATPDTIWRVVKATEDKHGNLPYKSIPMSYIHGIHESWMTGEPEWKRAWAWEINEWKVKGYKQSAILGRRCDFADGVVGDDGDTNIGNALVNYPILSTEADIANIVTTELVEAIPFGYAGPGTGLVQQNYDSILLEVPDHDIKRVAGILHDLMNRRFPELGELTFKADVAIAKTWDKV
jgi:DNA polymerase I-like protein with 3'-5' exonuclease and polymerase domains/uracil-DNA glycosylase